MIASLVKRGIAATNRLQLTKKYSLALKQKLQAEMQKAIAADAGQNDLERY